MELGAEFEQGKFLVTAWHDEYSEYFTELIAVASQDVDVIVLIDPDQPPDAIDEALDRGATNFDAVDYLTVPMDTFWVRDFGPWAVEDAYGAIHLLDAVYDTRPQDDEVPRALGQAWDLPVATLDLRLDGGNLLSDGRGRCVTTETALWENDASEDELRRAFAHAFGCVETAILPPLEREPTGHVDVFVSINGPGEALVARVDEQREPYNAALLDESARLLADVGFRVRRVPMPGWDDDIFRSYLNAVVLDDIVVVPVFDERDGNEVDALAVMRRAYGDREIVPIVADAIVQLEGAIHCTTLSYPVAARP